MLENLAKKRVFCLKNIPERKDEKECFLGFSSPPTLASRLG